MPGPFKVISEGGGKVIENMYAASSRYFPTKYHSTELWEWRREPCTQVNQMGMESYTNI